MFAIIDLNSLLYDTNNDNARRKNDVGLLVPKTEVVFVMVTHKTVNKGIPNIMTPASGL